MRRAGILLHPTSLPGDGPCGDLGRGAIAFLDWLAAAGCSLWQVLPLNPTGGGFSPYDSPGAFAGGTHLLSLERLAADGLLSHQELEDRPHGGPRVDRAALEEWHAPRVNKAAQRLVESDPGSVDDFQQRAPWVEDWALYSVLSRHHPGRGWWDFPAPLRERKAAALHRAWKTHGPELKTEIAAQLLFRRQWAELRAAAHARGIQIVGDLPIFVSGTGADSWAHRKLFRWADRVDLPEGEGPWRPDPIAGVPPDYFSPTGQCWGNPLYDWPAHRRSGFQWWVDRFRRTFELVDQVRADHFRGFAATWEIPASAAGDARLGAWRPGPGKALFEAVQGALGQLPIIAEDLGHITPDVHELRDSFGLPGMKILQFAFGGGPDHPFLPHNYPHPRWVAYTGTHDNDTAVGWYRSTSEVERHRFRVYVGRSGEEPGWDLIRLAWSSIARWAIAPMQDVLGLGSEGRMNIPGLAAGNWSWRCTELPHHTAFRLRELSESFGRKPVQGAEQAGLDG